MKVNWPERVWVNSPLRHLVQECESRFFKRLLDLPRDSRCLEIGCGRGVGLGLIARRFQPSRLDGLDIDPDMIRLAKGSAAKNAGRRVLMTADAQELPYRPRSLDAVFNFGIIHHLEDWKKGIQEIARVLRPGGRFYFEEIYPSLYANALFRRILAHPRENRFHGPEFRAALEANGLRILQGYRESRFGILGVAVKELLS
ncbi:MAG: class I SAM-dependent methyltransferase [Thermodesulfobacteriota bacterium]